MKVRLYLKKCHEALWNWLAKNPDKGKNDWPGWKTIQTLLKKQMLKADPIIETDRCFACAYSDSCDKCPVAFTPNKVRDCHEYNSYYNAWLSFGISLEKKSVLAKKIADGWVGEDR